jgi:hypothetical protein
MPDSRLVANEQQQVHTGVLLLHRTAAFHGLEQYRSTVQQTTHLQLLIIHKVVQPEIFMHHSRLVDSNRCAH